MVALFLMDVWVILYRTPEIITELVITGRYTQLVAMGRKKTLIWLKRAQGKKTTKEPLM